MMKKIILALALVGVLALPLIATSYTRFDDLSFTSSLAVGAQGSETTLFDSDGNFTAPGTITVGESGTGYDVKFWGDTAGKYWLWDEDADGVVLVGSFTQTGDMAITGDVSIAGTLTVGVDGTGHDVKFYGDTAGDYWLWDESADTMIITGSALVQTGTLTVSTSRGVALTGATSFTWDPASLADGAQEAKDVTVTGAALGDFVLVGAGVDVTDLLVSATVTATNTVTVVIANETGDAVDLDSSTWYVEVIQSH